MTEKQSIDWDFHRAEFARQNATQTISTRTYALSAGLNPNSARKHLSGAVTQPATTAKTPKKAKTNLSPEEARLAALLLTTTADLINPDRIRALEDAIKAYDAGQGRNISFLSRQCDSFDGLLQEDDEDYAAPALDAHGKPISPHAEHAKALSGRVVMLAEATKSLSAIHSVRQRSTLAAIKAQREAVADARKAERERKALEVITEALEAYTREENPWTVTRAAKYIESRGYELPQLLRVALANELDDDDSFDAEPLTEEQIEEEALKAIAENKRRAEMLQLRALEMEEEAARESDFDEDMHPVNGYRPDFDDDIDDYDCVTDDTTARGDKDGEEG